MHHMKYYKLYNTQQPTPFDLLQLTQLTLLNATEVTVVPAVWLTVLEVIPGTAAPTELWKRIKLCHLDCWTVSKTAICIIREQYEI